MTAGVSGEAIVFLHGGLNGSSGLAGAGHLADGRPLPRRPRPLHDHGRRPPHRIGLVPLPGGEVYLWMLDSTLPSERPPRERLISLFQERMAVDLRVYARHHPGPAHLRLTPGALRGSA